MTTVLDGDWTTVSTRLPFRSWGYAEPLAEPGDPGLAAEADEMQPGDSGQRARVLRKLEGDLEALRLGVGCALAPLDQLGRHLDPWHVLVDVAQRIRGAGEADRREQRALLAEPFRDSLGEERLEPPRL